MLGRFLLLGAATGLLPRAPALYVTWRLDARALRVISPLTVLAARQDDVDRVCRSRERRMHLPADALPTDVLPLDAKHSTLIVIERDPDITTLTLLEADAHFVGFYGGAYATRGPKGLVAALNRPRDDERVRERFVTFTYVGRDGSRTHADTWSGFQRTWGEDCERDRLLLPGWNAN